MSGYSICAFFSPLLLYTMATATTMTAPLTEEIKEIAALTEEMKATTNVGEESEVAVPQHEEVTKRIKETAALAEEMKETTNVGEESKVSVIENEETGDNNAVAKVSDTSATSTASNSLLLGCGDTPSIRSILCAAPLQGEISDDIDEVQKSFLGMFSKKEEASHNEDDVTLDEITAESDIGKPERRIWVVTTAGLPWRTGTSVNPLLRALYLTRGRPKGYVTLVIPWLNSTHSRAKLYGQENSFAGGQQEQEAWIRTFCRERAQCEDEEKNLNILFYSAVYRNEFGSIFPSVDISSLIPDEEADVAILEEPEHLNWFRVPPPETGDEKAVTEEAKEESNDQQDSGMEGNIAETMKQEKAKLCWRKFRHVVGIIHTNYSAYITQYGVGTSIIAAPALSMLSSIVVRAYCHRVIRLSAVLPSLAPNKEVTCNVHGVRSEFLDPCKIEATSDSDITEEELPAAIYFIGKVIWAKGFDWLLQIEDHFRYATGHYFPIDVYGGGPDEKAISRAFLGRNAQMDKKQPSIEPSLSEDDATAAAIFASKEPLRSQVDHLMVETDVSAIEVVQDDSSPTGSSVQITEVRSSEEGFEDEEEGEEAKDDSSPLGVIGDLSSNTVATGIATTQAVYSLADRIVKAGMKMTFTAKETTGSMLGEANKQVTSKFSFDPPKSTYELRRTPIPARFLGVKDHVLMRDIPDHKIFLNASVTEVLCTTTAEALAMGKFAVIPKHRK